jgi:hypothetical protein
LQGNKLIAAVLLVFTAAHGTTQTALRQAKLEDGTEKSIVTPGPPSPARELGEMLLETNNPREALVQFEATLRKEPRRFRSFVWSGARCAAQRD